MRFPWLISRRKLIFNCILEVILLISINSLIFSDYFKFEDDINRFTFSLIPFWTLLSYILGRYSYEFDIFKKKLIYLFINIFLKTFLVSILSLVFVLCIYLNINQNNFNHFDKLILFYSFLILFILLINSGILLAQPPKTFYRKSPKMLIIQYLNQTVVILQQKFQPLIVLINLCFLTSYRWKNRIFYQI